jgi:hypothetical protein
MESQLGAEGLNVQKVFDTLAEIIGRREGVTIKFTLTKKEPDKLDSKTA